MQSNLCKRDGGADGGLSLPEDIVFEVLLRLPLPPKALRRFQCVCKQWRALLADQDFLAKRRSRACADPLIVAMFGSSAPELELRLLDRDGNVLRVFDVRGTAALLAPTRLDLIFIDPASGRDFTIAATDDPQPQPPLPTTVNDYSFGRAVPSGDYKVLRLRIHIIETLSHRDGRQRSQGCEISTIMDDSAQPMTWRRRPWGPFSQTSFSCEHKAAVNGDLYFMLCNTCVASNGSNLIATFNLESEEWKAETIKGPLLGSKNMEDKWRIVLTELKGTLCMVHNVQNLTGFGGHYANLWLLKDPNSSVWAKENKIQMPETMLFTKPLDVLPDGTLLLLNKFRKARNDEKCHRYFLQFYNCSTKVFTELHGDGRGVQ